MDKLKIYVVTASQFVGRLPTDHRFEMAGRSKEYVINVIKNRWPYAYNIKVIER